MEPGLSRVEVTRRTIKRVVKPITGVEGVED